MGGWEIGEELFESVTAFGADPPPAVNLGDSLVQQVAADGGSAPTIVQILEDSLTI